MASTGKKQPIPHDSTKSEFVRRFKENPFIFVGTIVILVIVIVAFVLVPAIVPNAGGGRDLNFGTYNKTPINYVPGNYFAQVEAAVEQSQPGPLNIFTNYQVWREAFEATAVHTAILDEMAQAGYSPPKDVVDAEVARQFQTNGRFDAARYRQLDRSTQISLWRSARDDLTKQRYLGDISAIRVSSREAAFVAAMASPRRSFELAAFPFSSYPDTEIIAYVGANPDLFRLVHLSRITVNSSETEAQQVLALVQDRALTFEEAARTHSQDGYNDRGGDTGQRMAYELTTEIPAAAERAGVLALPAGQTSPLVKVPSGWAFFRAEEAPRPADMGESANLDKVRSYVMDFERGRVEDWVIGEAEGFIAQVKTDGFDAAAISRGLQTQSFGPLSLNYGENDLFTPLSSFGIGELGSAASNENFWRTAFLNTPVGSPSNPFTLGNSVLVIYPREENPADEDTIDSIKSAYSSYWVSYHAEDSLRSYFLYTTGKLQDRFGDTFWEIFSPSLE
jgi:hypothetical protein